MYDEQKCKKINSSTWLPILRGITSPTTTSYMEISTLLPSLITFTGTNQNIRLEITVNKKYS
jgi:hypothetical protein